MTHAERRPDAERIRSGYRVAVVGGSGAVGRTMIQVLEEREFPAREVVPFGSERSAGVRIPYRGEELEVQPLREDNYRGFDLALFSAGSEVSRIWAPKFTEDGCLVVDNSSQWRMHPEVPLIVPEVNAYDLDPLRRKVQIRRLRETARTVEEATGEPWIMFEREGTLYLFFGDDARNINAAFQGQVS